MFMLLKMACFYFIFSEEYVTMILSRAGGTDDVAIGKAMEMGPSGGATRLRN